jgi:dihydroorotate dehydrogenase
MRLRRIEFPSAIASSGALNFFREGYWFHHWLRWAGLNFDGASWVSKTTTLHERRGNMPLKEGETSPLSIFPECIKVYWREGVALNAVSLSGHGAEWLFKQGRWQKEKKPFFISFMSLLDTPEERTAELREFIEIFCRHLPDFSSNVGLEINFSCPNVGHDPASLVAEVGQALDVSAKLDIPVVPNFGPSTPVELVCKVAEEHDACNAISLSNTIPWGKLPEEIDWKAMFGTDVSPLVKFGGGGLSGKPLLPIVERWVRSAREDHGFTKPIMAGGGVLSKADVDVLKGSGASAVKLSTIGILRPWRVAGVVTHANRIFQDS